MSALFDHYLVLVELMLYSRSTAICFVNKAAARHLKESPKAMRQAREELKKDFMRRIVKVSEWYGGNINLIDYQFCYGVGKTLTGCDCLRRNNGDKVYRFDGLSLCFYCDRLSTRVSAYAYYKFPWDWLDAAIRELGDDFPLPSDVLTCE